MARRYHALQQLARWWRSARSCQPVSASGPIFFHNAAFDLLQSRYSDVIVVCPQVLESADVAHITGFVQECC